MSSAFVVSAAATGRTPAATSGSRRAADVAVVGGSLQAYAAAYLLARRGKRTVVIEHASPQQAVASRGSGPGQSDIVLHLPASTPHLVNEATESLALWRGIEAAADARGLLQLCGTIDVAPARGSSAASSALGQMQDASQAAGLSFGMLSGEEATASFPRLRAPPGSVALFTNVGGVVQRKLAAAVLRAMAQRAGAEVAPAALLGWRDAGSHFALRCAPTDAAIAAVTAEQAGPAGAAGAAGAAGGVEGELVWECEQLLLLPEAHVQEEALAAFGLSVPGVQLLRVPAGRWQAQEECGALPVWQLLGTGSSRGLDDPTAIDSCWGTPVLDWARGGLMVAQSLADGQAAGGDVADADAKQQRQQQQQQQQQQQRGKGAGSAEQRQADGEDLLAAAVAAAAGAALGEDWEKKAEAQRPGSEEAVDRELQRLSEEQRGREAAGRRLAAAGSLAKQVVYGLGSRLARPASWHLHVLSTPDGEPAVGHHPGFEQGRVVVGFPASGTTPGCLPGDQLAPLLARLAVGELLGQQAEGVEAARVALGREGLGAEAREMERDTWGL